MPEINKSEYNMNDVKDVERYLIDARNRMEEINTEVEELIPQVDKEELKDLVYKLIAENDNKIDWYSVDDVFALKYTNDHGILDNQVDAAVDALEAEGKICSNGKSIYNGGAYTIQAEKTKSLLNKIRELENLRECKIKERDSKVTEVL